MASIYSSIYGDEVPDVLHQAANDGFNTSSDELDRRPSATGALAAMLVGGNKLQAFQLCEFAAKRKPVKVKAMSKLSDAVKEAAPKDTAKSKKKAAANKVVITGLTIAWCFVIGLILFNSLHRNQQAGVDPSSAGDGAAGGDGGISSLDFPPSTKLQHLPMDRIGDFGKFHTPRRWPTRCRGPAHVLWGLGPPRAGAAPPDGVDDGGLGSLLSKDQKGAVANTTSSSWFSSPLWWGPGWDPLPAPWNGSHSIRLTCSAAPWPRRNQRVCPQSWPVLILQPCVLQSLISVRQLLLWCGFDESASTWVLGSSFFYFRQQHKQHPSVVGIFHLRRLHRPPFNRRFGRSVHLGACVFDAPANTPRLQIRPLLCHRRRCCLIFWSQDRDVTPRTPM